MKRIVLISLLIVTAVAVKAQSNLVVTSNNADIRFYIMVDDTQLNTFYETWVCAKNLPSGWHRLRIVFENDTVADVTERLNLSKGNQRTVTITKKSKIMRSMSAEGRGIGKFYNPSKHDSTFAYLYDMYYLESEGKEPVSEFGAEIEVDTEKSLSTSITPAAKSKPGQSSAPAETK